MTGYSAVRPHFDGTSLIVIAGGQAYVIDPEKRRLLAVFGGDIDIVLVVSPVNLFVVGNGIWLEAWDNSGTKWRSRRISWDGMRNLRIENEKIKGEAWSPIDNCDYPFAVDILTGVVEGGSYNGPPD